MSNYDYFGETQGIAEILSKSVFTGEARNITDAIIEGGTNLEIFMILRFRLALILKEKAVPEFCLRKIKLLHDKIDHELGESVPRRPV